MPVPSRLRSCGFALLGVACSLPPLAAQTQWEPYIGLYWPTSIFASDSGRTVKHQSSVALGLRVTRWWPSRWGFEVTFGYAPSSLASNDTSNGVPVYTAHVLTVSAQALRRLTPAGARARLDVGAGVSLVGHGGGSAYPTEDYAGPRTFLGGIASLGGHIKLNSWLGLRFDAEDYVYSAHLGPCGLSEPFGACVVYGGVTFESTGSRLQNDLVLSLGFSMNLTELNRPPEHE
jgi:outer membrane protein with beta-barrel domain